MGDAGAVHHYIAAGTGDWASSRTGADRVRSRPGPDLSPCSSCEGRKTSGWVVVRLERGALNSQPSRADQRHCHVRVRSRRQITSRLLPRTRLISSKRVLYCPMYRQHHPCETRRPCSNYWRGSRRRIRGGWLHWISTSTMLRWLVAEASAGVGVWTIDPSGGTNGERDNGYEALLAEGEMTTKDKRRLGRRLRGGIREVI